MNKSTSLQLLTILTLAAATCLPAQTPPAANNAPPVAVLAAPRDNTAEADHADMMRQLGLTALRSGRDGRNHQATNFANYDEAKANPYPNLPDVLRLKNGTKVTRPKQWWQQRRPEIVEDFDREVYGRVPANTPKVTWTVTRTTPGTNGNIPTLTKVLVGHVDNSRDPDIDVDISLTLTLPSNVRGPCPVLMVFGGGFGGGFGGRGARGGGRGTGALGGRGGTNGFGTNAPGANGFGRGFAGRGRGGFGGGGFGGGPDWHQTVLSNGWGYANLDPNSVQADNGAGLTRGIIGLMNKGQHRKPEDWGALRAWAWGASRALDYLETDRAVNAKQVGLEGHSRYGKATIVAMAYDQRFAIAYVSSSGEGGAKLSRRNWGETVENVAGTQEYHWMAGNFLKYAADPLTWNDLPVDSHELIAMCAPRPVFISGGAPLGDVTPGGPPGDAWVDAKGMFMAAAAAGPVYTLLGKKDMGTTEFPPMLTPLIQGDIAFRQHNQGHTDAPNWPTFIQFASRYLKGPKVTPIKAPPPVTAAN